MQTQFRAIIDDKLDDTLELQLANLAKTEIEEDRDWEFLVTLDESISSSSSDTYTTSHALPTRFLRPLDEGLYIGNDQIPYILFPYKQRDRYKNIARRWYIDHKNSLYYIAGTNISGTHHHFYIGGTADITTGQAWTFPSRFHPILPIKMAELFYPVNTGEKVRAWDDRWVLQYRVLFDSMVKWDHRLKSVAAKGAARMPNYDTYPNVVSGIK